MNKSHQAGAVLLGVAPEQDWARQAAALDDLLVSVVAEPWPLPAGLVDVMVRGGSDQLIAALTWRARNSDDDGLLRRITESARFGMGALFALPHEHKRIVLSSPPERACWHGPDGLVAGLLATTYPEVLRQAVGCPFPEVVRHALATAASVLTEAERHRALLSIQRAAGDDAVRACSRDGLVPPELTEDLDGLAARTERHEGTHGLIAELRATSDPAEAVARRDTIDWPLLVAAHERRPVGGIAIGVLAERPDCPDEALLALYRTDSAVVVQNARRVTTAMLAVPASAPAPHNAVVRLVARLVEDGHAETVLAEGRPALAVLSAVHARPVDSPAWEPLVAGLRELAETHLGEDPRAWRDLRTRLRRFNGTVAGLFGGAPNIAGAAAGGSRSGPGADRNAIAGLLGVVDTPTQMNVLPELDAPTTAALLGEGPYRADWMEHLTAYGTAAQRALLAGRRELSAADLDRLLELGEPLVDARVHRHPAVTPRQRELIIGRRLDPAFRAELLDRGGFLTARDAVACADPEVQLRILRHTRVKGETPQLRLLLNVWRRRGTDKMLELHDELHLRNTGSGHEPFEQEVEATLKELLAIGDEAAAVDTLTARLAHAESARWQIEALRDPAVDHVALLEESHDWHWPEIIAAHRAEPLPDEVFGRLGHAHGRPPEFAAEAERVLVAHTRTERALMDGADIAAVLADNPLGERRDQVAWVSRAFTASRVTVGDLLGHATPAYEALTVVARLIAGLPPGAAAEQARATLSDMVRDTIGTDPEAWVFALRLLGDFGGTVAELLTTAAAVVGEDDR
ncbi:hypothetical protein AB0I28_08190 [Phytomonospora sp. NPDC050363]|uniref:hypothetical protein n=1 Tax=Phytomonospora sp. NPDC050363 TaxID=3155642 RepID=UPI0033F75D73